MKQRLQTILIASSLLSACSTKNQNETNNNSEVNAPSEGQSSKEQIGFINVDGNIEQISYTIEGEDAIFEDHIRFPLAEVKQTRDEALGLTVHKGARKWKNGVVPYVLKGGMPESAMAHARGQFARAGIRLVPRQNEAEYLEVIMIPNSSCKNGRCSFDGLSKSLGFRKGKNAVYLVNDETFPQLIQPPGTPNPEAWKKLGLFTLLHEIGHAIGLRHEQAHPVARKKIKPLNSQTRFEGGGRALTGFDFKSVMLYCESFKRRRSPEPTPICDINDMATTLSALDVIGIRRYYNN